MEPYNPTDHTVSEVNEYLAQADDAERERVLDAEAQRDGGGRSTIDGYNERQAALAEQAAAEQAKADEPTEEGGPEEDPADADEEATGLGDKSTTTKAATFAEAAKAAKADAVGYLGTSPERERTGLADKGLSLPSIRARNGKPSPDPRQGVDDSAALNKG